MGDVWTASRCTHIPVRHSFALRLAHFRDPKVAQCIRVFLCQCTPFHQSSPCRSGHRCIGTNCHSSHLSGCVFSTAQNRSGCCFSRQWSWRVWWSRKFIHVLAVGGPQAGGALGVKSTLWYFTCGQKGSSWRWDRRMSVRALPKLCSYIYDFVGFKLL